VKKKYLDKYNIPCLFMFLNDGMDVFLCDSETIQLLCSSGIFVFKTLFFLPTMAKHFIFSSMWLELYQYFLKIKHNIKYLLMYHVICFTNPVLLILI